MAGTGLPIPKSGVLAQSPGVMDASGLTAAREWQQIAAAGARIANLGFDALERDAHAAKVGMIADRDVADKRKQIDLENENADNPQAFESAWRGYSNGVLSTVPPSLVDYTRSSLGALGNQSYGRILDRRRSLDRASDGEKISALAQSTIDDLGSIAMRGGLGTPEGAAATEKLRGVLGSAVTSGLWTQDKADLRMQQALGSATAEAALFEARQVYAARRATGDDALAAARDIVQKRIIDNPTLGLGPDERRAFASRLHGELDTEEAMRRQDLRLARQAANEMQNAMAAGVKVSPESIDNLVTTLNAAGGQAEAARLRAASLRADRLRSFGAGSLAQQNAEVNSMAGGGNVDRYMAVPNPAGMVERGNIDLYRRPQVKNADGSISTVRSMSFEEDGQEILVPTVSSDGKILSDEQAIAEYHRTGQSLGKFKSAADADTYAKTLHQQQQGVYGTFLDKMTAAESRGDPNADNPRSSALGQHQFTDGTWLDTVRRHRPDLLQGRTPDQVLSLRTDPALSREMAGYHAGDNAAALRSAGLPVMDGTQYLAWFAGVGGASDILRAAPSTPIERILSPEAITANPFLRGKTASQVLAWANEKMGGPGVGADDLRLAKDMQSELGKTVDKSWTKMKADFDAGIRPSPAALNDIVTGATLTGNSDLLEEIGDRVQRFDAMRQLGQGSEGEQQATVSALQQAGAAGILPPGRAAWLRDASAVRDATASGLENDPVALVATRFPDRFKAPVPLDVTNSANMQAGLKQRAAMVQFGQQAYGTPALSALGPGDLAAVQAVLDGPNSAAKLRVVTDLAAALPEDIRLATFAKMGTKGPAAALASFAGGLMPRDPEVANGILRGTTALVAEPRFGPTTGGEGSAFKEALDVALPPGAFGIGARTGATGSYSVLREAVRSRYADLAATVGDVSGKLDENRLQRAVDDVTGGMLLHNGSPLVAPARGMSQAEFDGILFGITGADLSGVRTLSGTPITPEYLRGGAKLESIGDGRYLVRLNNNPARPSYAVQDSGHPAVPPGVYILDLRGRRPVPIPSWNAVPPADGAPPPSWNFYNGPMGGLDSGGVRP